MESPEFTILATHLPEVMRVLEEVTEERRRNAEQWHKSTPIKTVKLDVIQAEFDERFKAVDELMKVGFVSNTGQLKSVIKKLDDLNGRLDHIETLIKTKRLWKL